VAGSIRKFGLAKITIKSIEAQTDMLQSAEEGRNSIRQILAGLSAIALFQQHFSGKLVKLSC
jgi:hypothetical protein